MAELDQRHAARECKLDHFMAMIRPVVEEAGPELAVVGLQRWLLRLASADQIAGVAAQALVRLLRQQDDVGEGEPFWRDLEAGS